jgi:hypothetical protein
MSRPYDGECEAGIQQQELGDSSELKLVRVQREVLHNGRFERPWGVAPTTGYREFSDSVLSRRGSYFSVGSHA